MSWHFADESLGGRNGLAACARQREIATGEIRRLRVPYSFGVTQSKYEHMRELRIQHGGRPYRVLYAFDPRRVPLLLIGGDKTGDDRWYDIFVPIADRLYDEHLERLRKEGWQKNG